MKCDNCSNLMEYVKQWELTSGRSGVPFVCILYRCPSCKHTQREYIKKVE